MTVKYVQTNTLYLAGAGTIVGATSITLTSFTDIYANVLTMASFGDKGYITLEPDTTNEEAATFTGVTANTNGTYTLTGVKTGLAQSPYTETSGLIRQHNGGTKVVVTDNVEFWNTFGNKHNDETIDGQWTFTNTPIVPGVVSDASTTVKGVSKTSVAPTSAGNPITVGDNDPRVMNYAVDSVGTDSYAITLTSIPAAYTAGQVITFKAGTANTGPSTLNVNGLGAKSIFKNVNVELATGDILANQVVYVEYDGTNFQLMSIPSVATPVINIYTSTGANTWTKPSGLKYVIVEVMGAGGGGGGENTTGAASGGGGGGYSKKIIPAATLGATETATVGSGGLGGVGDNDGVAGGTSTFGAHATGNGGAGGLRTSGGLRVLGGVGGTGTGGTENISGQSGFDGYNLNISTVSLFSGIGGNSYLGNGGQGFVTIPANAGLDGRNGTGYGGGGSGVLATATGGTTGGNGANGIIIVTEYYS